MKRAVFLGLIVACAGAALAGDKPAEAEKAPVLNEMVGTIQSLDIDNHLIRLQTDGGFNVEFAYDRQTACKGIDGLKTVADLTYKDQVTIRYAGKELIAREIEKRSLQPAIAASSTSSPAN